MTSKIWLISDTHFNHSRLLKFTDNNGKLLRGARFKNITDMNEYIIKQWNEKITPQDIVYHLGDVFFGDKEWFENMWPRLMGRKRLIVGNHDNIKYLAQGNFFQKILESRQFREHSTVLTHRPIMIDDGHKWKFNIHGHIHHNKSPTTNHYNISVENTDYSPVLLTDIVKKFK